MKYSKIFKLIKTWIFGKVQKETPLIITTVVYVSLHFKKISNLIHVFKISNLLQQDVQCIAYERHAIYLKLLLNKKKNC